MLIALCVTHAADVSRTQKFESAQFVASDSPRPPETGWQNVVLPDQWRQTHSGLDGYAWYRVSFIHNATLDQPLALYIPHMALIGEVQLNGSLLTPDIRFDSPQSMGTSTDLDPIFVTLPAGLFHSGQNVLDIRLQGNPYARSGLSAIWLGPPEALRSRYMMRHVILAVIPAVIMVLMIGMLCFLVIYAWRRHSGYVISLALLAAVALLLIYMTYGVLRVPFTRNADEALRVVASTFVFWGLSVAGYRLSNLRVRGLMPALHIMSAVCVFVIITWSIMGRVGDRAWFVTWPLVPLRFYIAGLVIYAGWKRRSYLHMALGITATFWLMTLVQTYLMFADMLPWNAFTLSIAGGLPFSLAIVFYCAEQFVVDREASLLAQQNAILAERERILQDMHDGMGAQLITALRLARREDVPRADVAHYIEESFLDLRLIIDSLDLTDHDLLPLLGNLRFRLDPRLRALGIELSWEVEPLPKLSYLTSASALAVLRIVQEALNNSLQHAHPTALFVSIKPFDHGIAICIKDDGRGFPGGKTRDEGRGIRGMQQRAIKLGAKLIIDSNTRGTAITLLLP